MAEARRVHGSLESTPRARSLQHSASESIRIWPLERRKAPSSRSTRIDIAFACPFSVQQVKFIGVRLNKSSVEVTEEAAEALESIVRDHSFSRQQNASECVPSFYLFAGFLVEVEAAA